MRLYLLALLVLAVLLVGHSLGISDGFYLSIKSYDIFAHILGGVGIGFFTAGVLRTLLPGMVKNTVLTTILIVFIVGLGWEAFEVYFNIAGYPFGTKLYYIDTVKDLVDDVIGGAIAALIARGITKPSSAVTEETV